MTTSPSAIFNPRLVIGLIAAGVAFYGLLAIFPGIVAAMAVAGLVMEPQAVVTQLEDLSRFIPREAAQIVIDQAVAVAGSESGGLGLAAVFQLVTAPVSAHMLGRAALRAGHIDRARLSRDDLFAHDAETSPDPGPARRPGAADEGVEGGAHGVDRAPVAHPRRDPRAGPWPAPAGRRGVDR